MRFLLDTHVLIWFINGDNQLSDIARKAIEDDNNLKFVSIASLWEIAVKVSLGKLDLNSPFSAIQQQLDNNGFQVLPITFADTVTVSQLAFHHRDPFDRIIMAQSSTNNLTIISKDKQFAAYGVSLLW